MSWSGNGIFRRVHRWEKDVENGIDISATRMDEEFDNFKTGLENCLTKTSETQPTSNLGMNGFKHLSVGKAEKRNEYATAAQLQEGDFSWGGVSGGKQNSYKIKLQGDPSSIKMGQSVRFIAHQSNEGSSVIKVNNIAAIQIKHQSGADLLSGDIIENAVVTVIYDGMCFQLMPQQKISREEIIERIESLSIVPIGTISAYAGKTAPKGWVLCNGNIYNASANKEYQGLYDVIKTQYGGEGEHAFAVPDLRGRAVFGHDVMEAAPANRITAVQSSIDGKIIGAAGGAEMHQLTIQEMPAHTHEYQLSKEGPTGNTQGKDFPTGKASHQTQSMGGSQPHNNMPPALILNYIIKY